MPTRSFIPVCLILAIGACAKPDSPPRADTPRVVAQQAPVSPAGSPPQVTAIAEEPFFDPSQDTTRKGGPDDDTRVPVLQNPALITQLPVAARDTLVKRGCRVPQWKGDSAANVLRGDFYGDGVKTWALWCVDSIGDNSRLVFFRDDRAAPDVLDPLGSPTAGGVRFHKFNASKGQRERYGCLSRIDATRVGKDWPSLATDHDEDSLTVADRTLAPHDAVLDSDCEGTSNIHYWTGKRWVILAGAN